MTELTPYRGIGSHDPAGDLVAWAHAATAAHNLATSLVKTDVVPQHLQGKPDQATAIILLGAELGLSPVASLRSMFVIRGQVGMYVRAQVALVQSRGHKIWTVEESDDRVVVAGHRVDAPEHVERVEWTIARAQRAGYIRRGARGEPSKYETDPRTMLYARAAGDVCRRIASDALQGVPELDEPGERAAVTGGTSQVARKAITRPPDVRPVDVTDLGLDVEEGRTVAVQPAGEPDMGGTPPSDLVVNVDQDEPPVDTDAQDDVEPLLSGGQRARIMAGLNALGIREHDERMAFLGGVLDRVVDSTNDLTVTEASAVIDRIVWETDQR